MGCSQSKQDEQVVEPNTAPASECGATGMEAAVFTESVVVDQSAATEPSPKPKPRLDTGSTTMEEDVRASEQPAGESEAVEETTEPAAVEVPTAETPAAEEPVIEEAAAEEAAVEEAVTDEPVAEEPPAETAVAEKSVSADVLTFTADKVTFSAGVAFYNMTGVSAKEPGTEVHLTKRFSEFRALHAEMEKLMPSKTSADEETPVLPALPKTSFLQARADKAMLEEREATFVTMLNTIARHPEAAQSEAFAAFCA